MAHIVRSKPARDDLRGIWLYIAQESMDAADRLLDRIDRTVRMLAESPAYGRINSHTEAPESAAATRPPKSTQPPKRASSRNAPNGTLSRSRPRRTRSPNSNARRIGHR